jgi:hypothetical protein
MSTKIYLMRSTSEPDKWWSAEGGWSELGEAAVYTEDEEELYGGPTLTSGEMVAFEEVSP